MREQQEAEEELRLLEQEQQRQVRTVSWWVWPSASCLHAR